MPQQTYEETYKQAREIMTDMLDCMGRLSAQIPTPDEARYLLGIVLQDEQHQAANPEQHQALLDKLAIAAMKEEE